MVNATPPISLKQNIIYITKGTPACAYVGGILREQGASLFIGITQPEYQQSMASTIFNVPGPDPMQAVFARPCPKSEDVYGLVDGIDPFGILTDVFHRPNPPGVFQAKILVVQDCADIVSTMTRCIVEDAVVIFMGKVGPTAELAAAWSSTQRRIYAVTYDGEEPPSTVGAAISLLICGALPSGSVVAAKA
ncbi:hypothetical protein HKX48_003818 [Thoreauomyces humboldtii]|nr:hypothetical protein HKX48_003818 [Thoreauomyces humboldtii]